MLSRLPELENSRPLSTLTQGAASR
jgi:hypothetical protein